MGSDEKNITGEKTRKNAVNNDPGRNFTACRRGSWSNTRGFPGLQKNRHPATFDNVQDRTRKKRSPN